MIALNNPGAPETSIQTVEYEYDNLSRLKTVKTIRRDSADVDLDNNPANGVLEVFGYDAMSRLIERSQKLASNPSTVLSQFTYSYDPDNNPTTSGTDGKRYRATEKTRVQPAVGPAELRTSEYVWTYDGAGRMVKEVLDHWDNTLDHTEDYLYDLVGNRVKKTTDNPNTAGVDSVTTYTYNQNDQAIAEFVDLGDNGSIDETISYTWQGTQQTSKTTTVNSVNVDKVQFVYNLRGQLSRVTTETRNGSNQLTKNTQVNYRYDIAGIRNVELSYNDVNLDGSFATNEKSGSISYTINHQSMTGVAEVLIETHRDGNDNLVKRVSYTFAEDELTQTTTEYNPANGQQTSKTTLTFGHDGHGSVRAVFGASAALLQAFTYAAFGELLAVHSTTGQSVPVAQALTRMLYSGEATDPNTGMQYLRARWYDTNSGRFATLDPHGGVFENPLTMNKYAYTSGDPISYNDPTGEFEGLAGMMSSMGNMMANFGMRMSQGLRMMKLARNLQKYVKMFQTVINYYEKVTSFIDAAESIFDFFQDALAIFQGFQDVFEYLEGGLSGGTGGSAPSSEAYAAARSPGGSTSTANKAIGSAFPAVTFKMNSGVAEASVKVTGPRAGQMNSTNNNANANLDKAWPKKINGQKRAWSVAKKIPAVISAIAGKVKASEQIGEWGVYFVMRGAGFADGPKDKRVHGIDIIMKKNWGQNATLWAIVEAKGGKSKLKRGQGGGPDQMSGKWIGGHIKYLDSQNIKGASELKSAWDSQGPFIGTVITTKLRKDGWYAKVGLKAFAGGANITWPANYYQKDS